MIRKFISGELGRCALAYSSGAVIYSLLEIAFRGFTHWTMTLTGGACMTLIYLAERKLHNRKLWLRCITGTAIITALEFAVGCIVNRKLGWNVWDYSDRRFNVLGQICPLFSAIWFVMCIPATALCKIIRKLGSGSGKPSWQEPQA
ncbi:MAG: hypothetical protein GX067_04360 [Clostridiales bacterium]|nr:hypothetical protein [Clostridiales bacterium]